MSYHLFVSWTVTSCKRARDDTKRLDNASVAMADTEAANVVSELPNIPLVHSSQDMESYEV